MHFVHINPRRKKSRAMVRLKMVVSLSLRVTVSLQLKVPALINTRTESLQ